MAITINRQPPEIDFTGNDIYYHVKGNSYANDVTSSSVATLTFEHSTQGVRAITAGQKLIISFNDIKVEITFVSSPDESGNQISIYHTIQQIAEDLKQNYYLNKYYIITCSTTKLIFTSKDKPGVAPTFDLSQCSGLLFHSSITGSDYLVRGKNFKIHSSLYIQSGVDSFTIVNEMSTAVDTFGVSTIVVSGLLKKLLDVHQLPIIYSNSVAISHRTKKYYLEFAEFYDNKVRKLNKSVVRHAIAGKIPNLNHANYNYQTWLTANRRFLTNIDYTIFTTYKAEQYLYFLADIDRSALKVFADIEYTNGNVEHRQLYSFPLLKKGEVLCIPAGVVHSGIHINGSIVKEYAINLYTDPIQRSIGLISSNQRTIKLATAKFEVGQEPTDALYFCYLNSLNAYETLIAQRPRSEVTTKRSATDKFILDGFNADNLLEDSSTVYEAITIPLTEDEQLHFYEFLDSDNIYLNLNRRRYKVLLEAATTETLNTAKQIQAIKFKYKIAISGEVIDEKRAYDDPAYTHIVRTIDDINVNNQITLTRDIVNPTPSSVSIFNETPNFQIANLYRLGLVRGGGNVRIDEFGKMWVTIPNTPIKLLRFDYNSDKCYCGTAPSTSTEITNNWTLTKIIVSQAGETTVTHAKDSWENRLTALYK